jgi:hypothetical protein
MKTIKITLLGMLASAALFAQQNTLTATTLSAAITAQQNTFTIASATNVLVPTGNSAVGSQLFVQDAGNEIGELMQVSALSGTSVTVTRAGNQRKPHISGAMVLVGNPQWFQKYDPTGSCTTASTFVTPWVNTVTGKQWLCSSVTGSWVPGWGTPTGNAQTTGTVASVAGATAVNGPKQKVSGTNAITSFTMGPGWNGEDFCIFPTGAYTTTATNNIGKATTAVANQVQCWYWDKTSSAFFPSY